MHNAGRFLYAPRPSAGAVDRYAPGAPGKGENMHKFKIGQSVHFSSNLANRLGARGSYKVVKLLPVEADQLRYRIKGTHENFERVAEEYQLTSGL